MIATSRRSCLTTGRRAFASYLWFGATTLLIAAIAAVSLAHASSISPADDRLLQEHTPNDMTSTWGQSSCAGVAQPQVRPEGPAVPLARFECLLDSPLFGKSLDGLDRKVFEALSTDAPHPVNLWLATFFAEQSVWVCMVILVWAALKQRGERAWLFAILMLAAATSAISKELAEALGMARPFMAGISPQHIDHGARPGFPSTHASVLYAVSFLLLARRRLRNAGWLMVGIATATAWARIYTGVHFPLDIVAGAALAAAFATACCMAGWARRPHSAVGLDTDSMRP
jgi:membrane-associated phospholipid phosphatase